MKYILTLLLFVFPLFVNAQTDSTNIIWNKTTHDFGKIPFGVPATFEFSFLNKNNDLVQIVSVEASCGCTQPEWTKESIDFNGKGIVKATYSAKVSGPFKKQITVYTSKSSYPTILYLQGEVLPDTN
jgi:hypothetical protein